MQYYVDGYNFIFAGSASKSSLEAQRDDLIHYLHEIILHCNLKITVVFDSRKLPCQFQRSYQEDLEMVYAPAGQTADNYILERITLSKHPKQVTVVTSDKMFALNAKDRKAKTMSIDEFVKLAKKRMNKQNTTNNDHKSVDTSFNDYYLKIFQDKINEN